MTTPRSVRFIQALLLAAAVPACGVEVGAPSPDAAPAQQVRDKSAVASSTPNLAADQDGGASLDGGAEGPFSSGPIVPPQERLA